MRRQFKYFFIFLFFSFFLKGQVNLVPNPSFETYDTNECWGYNLVPNPFSTHIFLPNWQTFKYLTPDYYNTCSNNDTGHPYPNGTSVPLNCRGIQNPRTGNAYVGICLFLVEQTAVDYREIISVKLETPLKANYCYYGEFYINLGNISNVLSNNIQMQLSDTLDLYNPFTYNNFIQPQLQWDTTQFFTDSLNWVKVSGIFKAQGGEKYLSIGNYKDSLHTKIIDSFNNFISPCSSSNSRISYVNIDDVALYEIPIPQLQTNAITICPNADSLVLGDTARIQTHYQWFANGTAIDTTSFIKVKPTQTTTYVLRSTNCTTTSQTIIVTYRNNCEPVAVVEPIIPNVFTPNNDSINDVWRFSLGKGNTLKDITIFNRWGNLLYQKINNLSQTTVLWDGRTTSGEETPSGVYFYVLQYMDANGAEHKKNGYITLIR